MLATNLIAMGLLLAAVLGAGIFGCRRQESPAPPRGDPSGGRVAPMARTEPPEPASDDAPPPSMAVLTEQDRTILSSSNDRRQLHGVAMACATSSRSEDVRFLATLLASPEFFTRLDSPEDYAGNYHGLRLTRVISTLANNPAPHAQEALLGLMGAEAFQGSALRMQALVRALAAIRPSPPEAIEYWNKLSGPDSPIAFDIVGALCANQSEPALALLDRKFSDARFDDHAKIAWMRQLILLHRNDAPLLEKCEDMVTRTLSDNLRPHLIEALFDYRPDDWYRGDSPPSPPPRDAADKAAQDILRRIGEYALKTVPLSDRQKQAVRRGLAELG